MNTTKYEIVPISFGNGYHHETIIGLLTGLSLEEIKAVHPNNKIWYTKDYINSFQALGFSTSVRFKKFDPETKYPCIMRCKVVGEKNGYWYGWIYYDYKVYDTRWNVFTFDQWLEYHTKNTNEENYRVTSMLQVWI